MPRSKDPITAAVTRYLAPYLESESFVKVTNRGFAKEIDKFIIMLGIDASGTGGKKRARVNLWINLGFDGNDMNGCYDPALVTITRDTPHGSSWRWDMSSHDKADQAMAKIIEKLNSEYLEKIYSAANDSEYIKLLSKLDSGLAEEMTTLISRWQKGDPELAKQFDENKKKLKLLS